jgi:hypothetical protein
MTTEPPALDRLEEEGEPARAAQLEVRPERRDQVGRDLVRQLVRRYCSA